MYRAPPRVHKTIDTAPIARRTRSQTTNVASAVTPPQAAQRRYPAKFLQRLAMPVLDETFVQSLQYRQLRKHPKFAHIWNTSYANELGQLYQGIGKGSKVPRQQHMEGTNTFRLIKFADIPRVAVLGILNLFQSLVRVGQVHWRMRCSKCVQNWGAYAVGGIAAIDRKFRQGRA